MQCAILQHLCKNAAPIKTGEPGIARASIPNSPINLGGLRLRSVGMPSSPFQRGYFQLEDFPDLRLKLCESLLCADPDFGPFSFGPDDTLEVISSSAGYGLNVVANSVPNPKDRRRPRICALFIEGTITHRWHDQSTAMGVVWRNVATYFATLR